MNVDLPPVDLSPGPRAMPLASLGVFFAIFISFSVYGTIAVLRSTVPAALGFHFLRPFLCGAGICFRKPLAAYVMHEAKRRQAFFNPLRLHVVYAIIKHGLRSRW